MQIHGIMGLWEKERKIDEHLRQGFIRLPMLFSQHMIIKVVIELRIEIQKGDKMGGEIVSA